MNIPERFKRDIERVFTKKQAQLIFNKLKIQSTESEKNIIENYSSIVKHNDAKLKVYSDSKMGFIVDIRKSNATFDDICR